MMAWSLHREYTLLSPTVCENTIVCLYVHNIPRGLCSAYMSLLY